jgi:hypothetical protein
VVVITAIVRGEGEGGWRERWEQGDRDRVRESAPKRRRERAREGRRGGDIGHHSDKMHGERRWGKMAKEGQRRWATGRDGREIWPWNKRGRKEWGRARRVWWPQKVYKPGIKPLATN